MTKQFDIVKNKLPESKGLFPYFLVLQHDFLAELKSVVVVPIRLSDSSAQQLKLAPEIDLDGETYVILMPSLASIPRKLIGSTIANIENRRDEIIRAYDLIISGI